MSSVYTFGEMEVAVMLDAGLVGHIYKTGDKFHYYPLGSTTGQHESMSLTVCKAKLEEGTRG